MSCVCGGSHTSDQPWILDGVADVSARWGRHLMYRGSIISRHKRVFFSLRLLSQPRGNVDAA